MENTAKGFQELSKLCKQASTLFDRFDRIFSDIACDIRNEVSLGDEGKKKKKKRDRDPEEPRRPESSYFRFQKACIPQISAMNPGILHKEKLQMAAKMWQDLDDESKKKWEDSYQRDLAAYMEESAKYKSKSTSLSTDVLGEEKDSSDDHPGGEDDLEKKKRKFDAKKKHLSSKSTDFDFADASKMAYI